MEAGRSAYSVHVGEAAHREAGLDDERKPLGLVPVAIAVAASLPEAHYLHGNTCRLVSC